MADETDSGPDEPPAVEPPPVDPPPVDPPSNEPPPAAAPPVPASAAPPPLPPSNVPMASPPPVPPSGTASAGPPATTRPTPQITLAQVLIVLGAVAVVVSLFLHWLDISVSAGGQSISRTADGSGVPVQFLFDRHTNDNDPSILIVLIPAGALACIGAALHKKVLPIIAGVVSLFVAAAYVYQLNKGVDELNDAARGTVHVSLSDFLGIAPYVCGVGALVMLVGAFVDRAPSPAAVSGGAQAPPPPPTP